MTCPLKTFHIFLASILFCVPSIVTLGSEKDLPAAVDREVDYLSDVKPIFENNCYGCHGASKQKSGFRLDARDSALSGGDYGVDILPGNSEESPLIHYVAGIEKDIVMPPSGDPLTEEEVGILRAWIDQGANWPESEVVASVTHEVLIEGADHWAFQKPMRHPLPPVEKKDWSTNPIDYFVLHRLEQEGFEPSDQADKRTLIRRVTLDLIGLPPTPAEVEAFVEDDSRFAYEKLVDRLLESPHFGERWARLWLDSARYADTNGYEKDRPRSIWPYRDWVIDAFNQNKPFDQFTIEQIAGDMLPDAGLSERIATGFHRNTMINEEGGIDVEEFRYHSVVDRVHTTSTVFLGLTVACAQCHDHKYDPISQREYYQFMSFLNNADEPELKVPDPETTRERQRLLEKIGEIKSDLPNRFPPYEEGTDWTVLKPHRFASTGGATLTKIEDGTLLAVGDNPERATYTLRASVGPEEITTLRLEVMPEPDLGGNGPGRTPHGNFVLSEFEVTALPEGGAESIPISFREATADVSQNGYDISSSIDGDAGTGWGIQKDEGDLNQPRTALFHLEEPLKFEKGANLTFRLVQNFGGSHTIQKFRISTGREYKNFYQPELPVDEQRAQHLAAKFEKWIEEEEANSREWNPLPPQEVVSDHNVTLKVLDDHSVLASGDNPNRDTYTARFEADDENITGIRLEVLTHESLPMNGPGRGIVMGNGTFMLTEVYLYSLPQGATAGVEGTTIELKNPTADYFQEKRNPELALDRVRDTGWAIEGEVGKPHWIVLETSGQVNLDEGSQLKLVLLQNYIHQETIGRFRFSVTSDEKEIRANPYPAEIEAILAKAASDRSEEEIGHLKRYHLSIAPELKDAHERITKLEERIPRYNTTLVMEERTDPRETHIHVRGEFLRTGRSVQSGVPAVLHEISEVAPRNRLTFAKWLVNGDNPLVGRVTMNRFWATLFGRGLVTTPEDFGTRCDLPSHPELLDWLATEFVRVNWDMKDMLRLMVTSSTYKQSSRISPELIQKDPYNVLLARGPRFRIEAEMVRDVALATAGLLNREIGGPSVFPPQPEGVTQLAWGGWKWEESEGADRRRRGLYTYFKRATPYPGMLVFDAPAADTCVVARRNSNTPLQALTLLNDQVFLEAARALGQRILHEAPGTVDEKIRWAFELAMTRPPSESEGAKLRVYYDNQIAAFKNGTDPTLIVPVEPEDSTTDTKELAAWKMVARVILNLDEAITKE